MGSNPSKANTCNNSQPCIRGLLESDEKSPRSVSRKKESVKSPFINFISRKLQQNHDDHAQQMKTNKSENSDKQSCRENMNAAGDLEKLLNTEETNLDGRSDYYDTHTDIEPIPYSEHTTNCSLPMLNVSTVNEDFTLRKSTEGYSQLSSKETKLPNSSKMSSSKQTPRSDDVIASDSFRMTSDRKTPNSVPPDYQDARASDHFITTYSSKDNDGNMSSDLERGNTSDNLQFDIKPEKPNKSVLKKKKILKPYTAEQIEQKKADILTLAKELMLAIVSTSVKIEDEKISHEFKKVLVEFSHISDKIRSLRKRKATVSDVKSLKLDIGNEIHKLKVMDFLCEFIIFLLSEENFKPSADHVLLFLILLNFSDCTPVVCEDICQHAAFMEMIIHRITAWVQPCKDGALKKNGMKILEYMLTLVYNISSVDSNIPRLRSLSFTQVLLPYLEVPQSKIRLSTIASLADIVDEDDCELLKTNCKIISFLLTRLSKALRNSIHKELGWSAEELCRTVGRLTRNDANKRLLVELGCLPLLTELALSEDPYEEREAFQALWMLSFDDNNKNSIMSEPDLINIIISKHETCTIPETKKLLHGILWTLRDKLAETEDYKHIGENISGKKKSKKVRKKSTKQVVPVTTGHVMISYQWGHQTELIRIRDALKERGFSVWMDIDDMGGSTLQAMAEAIEDAMVVLVCMTSKYKNSPNCRAEAEYAFQKRKPIIPLMLEEDYRPDGWLGLILGSKLFHDFSGKYSFELKKTGLLKELLQWKSEKTPVVKDAVASPTVEDKQTKQDVFHTAKSPDKTGMSLVTMRTWSCRQVKAWLLKNNIKSDKLQSLSGKEVVFLKNVRQEAPEFFYQTLKTDLGLKSLSSLVDFTDLLESLR